MATELEREATLAWLSEIWRDAGVGEAARARRCHKVIQELEAEVERLRHDLERSVEASADLASESERSRMALERIAKQLRPSEMPEDGDWEAGYDECVKLARNTLQDDK